MCEFTGMNSKMNSYIWILTYDFIIFIMFMNSFPNSYYTFTAAYGPRQCDFCFPCFESLHGEGSAAKRKPICQTLRNIRVTWTPRNKKWQPSSALPKRQKDISHIYVPLLQCKAQCSCTYHPIAHDLCTKHRSSGSRALKQQKYASWNFACSRSFKQLCSK